MGDFGPDTLSEPNALHWATVVEKKINIAFLALSSWRRGGKGI